MTHTGARSLVATEHRHAESSRTGTGMVELDLTSVQPDRSSPVVPRQRLSDAIVVDPAPVTLLCAPAGSGKSTVLRALALADPATPVVSVTAEHRERGPHTLWTRLVTALQRSPSLAGHRPAQALRRPADATGPDFVDTVVDALSTAPSRLRLVIDDLHLVKDRRILDGLNRLLARQPGNVLLVLSSRHDPPLDLHLTRLNGHLREIRGTELAFRHAEVVELLDRAGCQHDGQLAATLLQCTEGWAAGIRMAVLSLLAGSDADELLADLGGRDQAIADYLLLEILDQQPPYLRDFLLTTSICPRLPAELAVEISGREDAVAILDELVRQQALTERDPRDRHVYRYHAVLRTYLEAERRHRWPSREAALQRRAGEWFASRGDWLHALEHVARGDRPERFVRLLRDHALRTLVDGRVEELRRVLDQLAPELHAEPSVALVRALVGLAEGRRGATRDAIAALDLPALLDGDDPWLATLAAIVQLQLATFGDSLEPALEQLQRLTDTRCLDAELELLADHHKGFASLWLGDLSTGTRIMADVADRARSGGRDALVVSTLGHLATAALMREDLRRAGSLVAEVRSITIRRGWEGRNFALPPQVNAAWIAYQRIDRPGARDALDRALACDDAFADPRLLRSLRLVELLVQLDEGAHTYTLLREQRRSEVEVAPRMSPIFHATFGPLLVWAALALGETGWARSFADRHSDHRASPGEHALMRAQLAIASGQDLAAGRMLRPLLGGDVTPRLPSTMIHAHLLAARIARTSGATPGADDQLQLALRLADECGVLRPFVTAGPEVREQLLATADRSGPLTGLANEIIDLAGFAGPADAGHTLLTATEVNVLREMPSLLTVREIAAARSVSPNTVKSHLASIYRKLGVNGRREAVEVARRRGLL